MLSWPDALCKRLAAGGRRVVRYDLRDSEISRARLLVLEGAATAIPDASAIEIAEAMLALG